MFLVKHILQNKGSSIWKTTLETTVENALLLMAEKNIGAVLVVDNDEVVGVFSERDLARKLSRCEDLSLQIQVKEFMTSPVFIVRSDDTLKDCMNLMTNKHIRHLPVLDNDRLIGLVSIGDIVKGMIMEYEQNIHHLERYICEPDIPLQSPQYV